MEFKFSPMYVVVPVLAVVGGVFAFAETSVPGNTLYPIKVSISEPIIGVFAFSREDKVEWNERLIERRLREATKLVSADNLSEPIRASIETNIKNQIDKFRVNVSTLAGEKNGVTTSSDLNLRLEAALNAYQSILEKLSEKTTISSTTKTEVTTLLSTLTTFSKEDSLTTTSSTTSSVSAPVASTSAYTQSVEATALNTLNGAKLLYQKNKLILSINIQNEVDGNLANAEQVLSAGKAFSASADYINATAKFQSVITLANQAKLSILSNVIGRNNGDETDIEWGSYDD